MVVVNEAELFDAAFIQLREQGHVDRQSIGSLREFLPRVQTAAAFHDYIL
jgi:hypothetical protein